ncbi:hypothetical protein BGW39_006654 [Mortierella sp. 14UC]|nr:hypothetical protein BGW39_006654 [Mortierella sp. 14UC]
MDNCRIHKPRSVKEAFNASQHTTLFLPPCTPHFNIAERAFGCIKGHVKKESVQRYNLAVCIRRSLQRSVTATKVESWLEEVAHNFQLARANMPLDRFMNTKKALYLVERGPDPYPEVEHDDMEGEDGEEEEEEEEGRRTRRSA